MEKSKEPIRIRKRALRNGNISLYLDIYINGDTTPVNVCKFNDLDSMKKYVTLFQKHFS